MFLWVLLWLSVLIGSTSAIPPNLNRTHIKSEEFLSHIFPENLRTNRSVSSTLIDSSQPSIFSFLGPPEVMEWYPVDCDLAGFSFKRIKVVRDDPRIKSWMVNVSEVPTAGWKQDLVSRRGSKGHLSKEDLFQSQYMWVIFRDNRDYVPFVSMVMSVRHPSLASPVCSLTSGSDVEYSGLVMRLPEPYMEPSAHFILTTDPAVTLSLLPKMLAGVLDMVGFMFKKGIKVKSAVMDDVFVSKTGNVCFLHFVYLLRLLTVHNYIPSYLRTPSQVNRLGAMGRGEILDTFVVGDMASRWEILRDHAKNMSTASSLSGLDPLHINRKTHVEKTELTKMIFSLRSNKEHVANKFSTELREVLHLSWNDNNQNSDAVWNQLIHAPYFSTVNFTAMQLQW